MASYGAETCTLRAAYQIYPESFEMWCWRRMEKISWTDHVRNEEVLLRVNGQRNILHEIWKRKVNRIGHILRRNCLLKQVIEGKIKGEMEVARRRGRRCRKLLDDLKDRRGYSHLKEEALDRTVWRNHFGGGFGPVVRQNNEWMNEWVNEWMYTNCSLHMVNATVTVCKPVIEQVIKMSWLIRDHFHPNPFNIYPTIRRFVASATDTLI